MDKDRKDMADCLEVFSRGALNGRLSAVFAVGLGPDGPLQVVFVEPDDRESLIIAINEEATRMLGTPHHLVSTEKLQEFLDQHGITDADLLAFKATSDE